jgi:hypothetical protein
MTKRGSTTRTVAGAHGLAVTRRRFLASVAATFGNYGVAMAAGYPVVQSPAPFRFPETGAGVIEQVIPKAGVPTGIAFEDSIQKLIAAGVIDLNKFRAALNEVPAWVERLLLAPSDDPIVFSPETAPYLVNLLWPIGLSNKAAFNENSPINTLGISSFASTGGWTLGRQPNGYVYFNQVEAVRMTDHRQAMALAVARSTYRPCCNNSTFFQDCNHGSALLGLLELAASQGATLKGLYALALTANSYWFPDHYPKTALYFSHFYRKSWRDIDAKLILSAAYSSGSGWENNVNYRLRRANVSLPGISNGQQGC